MQYYSIMYLYHVKISRDKIKKLSFLELETNKSSNISHQPA